MLYTVGKHVNTSFDERAPGPLFKKSHIGIYFPKIHFVMLSHPSTQKSLQQWPKKTWLLLELLANLGVIHTMLVLLACRMQELWVHGAFHSDFRGSLGRPRNGPWETDVGMKIKVQCRCQEVRDDRNMETLLWKAVGGEWSQLQGEAMWAASGRAMGWGSPNPLDHICHHQCPGCWTTSFGMGKVYFAHWGYITGF